MNASWDQEQPLDRAVLTLWHLRAATPFVLPLLGGLILAGLAGGAVWLLPAIIVIAATAAVILLPPAQYRRARWRLTHDALEYRRGVWLQRTTAIPFFRIQHIDVHHGPVDRLLGLATLVVHTASVTIHLSGLSQDTAPALRSHLLTSTRTAVDTTELDDAV